MEKSLELSMDQMEKVTGGMQASNLIFTGKTVKYTNAVQKGESPKAGGLVHKEARTSRTIIDEGIEGIHLSGGGEIYK